MGSQHLDQVIAVGDSEHAKALVRLLITETRINSRNEILSGRPSETFRPGVGSKEHVFVERIGSEPMTSSLQS